MVDVLDDVGSVAVGDVAVNRLGQKCTDRICVRLRALTPDWLCVAVS